MQPVDARQQIVETVLKLQILVGKNDIVHDYTVIYPDLNVAS